ncbi:MAG: MerR family transcriptional regulator [Bacteroidales bacterium]|nr:MerR family transcriptional regulator [Bacteroidales bacterium]MCL2738716.1 MerR family transcriptional regulator [Bacteroidales bacterium]
MDNKNNDATHKQKDSYSLNEVSEIVGVNTWTIRYWIYRFDVIQPLRDKKGDLRFVSEDIDKIKLICRLIKIKGMKRADIRKHLAAIDAAK